MVELTKFALKRPMTVILGLITIAYFGLQSLMGTKVELTPEMELPMLVVSTVYAGASPEDIQELITSKQEDAVSSLDNVDTVYSYSQENVGLLLVQYEYGTNMDTAYINMKKAMDSIQSDMPDEAEEVNILEMDMNAAPVLVLTVSGAVDGNLYTFVDNNIVPEFEKLGSVGEVSLSGGQESYISVQLIPEKMEQYHLSMTTVGQIVGAADFTLPAGTISVGSQELSVSAGNDYDTTESLKNIPIPLANGDTIHLSDIANVSDTLEEVDLSVAATLYGVEEADISDGTVYMSLSAGAEEIAVLVLADADAAAAALEGLEAHVADQRAALENYQPDEVSKLDGAILQQKGSSVLLAVCADPEAAKAVLGELG